MNRHHCVKADRRVDLRTSLLLDAAINMVLSHELIPVVDELAEQGVEPHLVLRVLTKPRERRCYTRFQGRYRGFW